MVTVAAVVLVLAVGALAALCAAYRYALVRGIRDRHPRLWEELARPVPLGLPTPRSAWRLSAFVRAGRHYTLNDADLAAAGRLYVVTSRTLAALVIATAVGLLLRSRG
jgi:hypothetical protein